jgi:hypothetical protein
MTAAEELIARTRKLGMHLWVSEGALQFRAPRTAVTAELRSELLAHKASIIDALSGPRYERGAEVDAIDVPEALASPWRLDRAGVVAPCYTNNTNWACRLRFPVNLQLIERALYCMTRQHNALRARLEDNHSGFRLVFDCTPTLTIIDVSDRQAWEVEYTIVNTAQGIVWRPFARGECLFRPYLLKLPSSESVIGFVVHHFLVDGWSLGQIPGYWLQEYAGQLQAMAQPTATPDYLQCSDYLQGIENWTKTLNFRRRLEYWHETLRGVVSSGLPPDHALGLDEPSGHHAVPFNLDADRVSGLTQLASTAGVTLSDVLLAGVAIALQRSLGITDICLRQNLHGRDEPKLFEMVGATLNRVLLRVQVNPQSSLAEVAKQMHRVVLDASAKQVPVHYVDELLGEPGAIALVQTNFRVQERAAMAVPGSALDLPAIEPVHIWNPQDAFATPRFMPAHDINLSLVSGTVAGTVVYLQRMYEDRTIGRFIEAFHRALGQEISTGA